MHKILFLLLSICASMSAFSKPTVERVLEMPVDGLLAVVDNKGTITLTTTDGRYVIKGQIWDAWLSQYLDTEDQLRESAQRLPLERIGIDVDDLGALTLGGSGKVTTIFTDPLCGSCTGLLEQAKALAETGQHQFKIVVIPALGDESATIAQNIACEPNREKALNAILNHTPKQITANPSCDLEKYLELLLTLKTIRLDGVPFTVSDDGRVLRGLTKSLEDWINQENAQ